MKKEEIKKNKTLLLKNIIFNGLFALPLITFSCKLTPPKLKI
ncbi:MAG: hypothetical protein ACTTJO_03275 [Metamycoplasmataceae bacterium]